MHAKKIFEWTDDEMLIQADNEKEQRKERRAYDKRIQAAKEGASSIKKKETTYEADTQEQIFTEPPEQLDEEWFGVNEKIEEEDYLETI